ncbi:TetR/AcrR family transcriptional regulator [Nocardia sp. KC 131]|uniref:TetR/AcrR family transcriptional regulator n=1 Tax=Nocardia arseniciresistens TaxID=3392119 RepID=UPI00398E5B81
MTKQPTSKRATRPSGHATRARILAVALDLFSELSYDGASLRDIAARAGVTQPLLNYHFSTKDELWRAAVDVLFDDLTQVMAARVDGLRGVDEVSVAKLLIRELVYFSAEHPQMNRIINQECKVDSARMDWLVEKHVRPRFEQATALLEYLVAGGHVPNIPAVHFYYILTGASSNMFVLGPECRRLSGVDPRAREVVEAHADAVIALLFGR